MALDSLQKRFAAARRPFPVAAKDGPWRITAAKRYPVAVLASIIVETSLSIISSISNSITKSILKPDI